MKLTPDSVAFFQMVQRTIENRFIGRIACFNTTTTTELADARDGAIITEAELFFENRGLTNGGAVGWIDYRGFSLTGRLINGTLFEAYGQVGRKHGREQWCSVGVTFRFSSKDDRTGQMHEGGRYTSLGYCDEGDPFRMCSMADKRTDFVQWHIENVIQDQTEEALHRKLTIQ